MFKFFREFLKNPHQIGAVASSSKFLARKMLKYINFDKDLVIVELGPGKGVFTREILKRMTTKSRLYIFETNKTFIQHLKNIKDSRLELINTCSSKIGDYLHGKKADAIISGLPFGSLCKTSDTIVLEILNAIKDNMKNGGIYTQFQYFLSNKKEINDIFGDCEISFEPRNIPPAFVYKTVK